MDATAITSILTSHRAEIEELGLESIRLFGYYARGEQRPDSDVDLLVEFHRPVGLLHLAKVQIELSILLGLKVDIATPDSLHKKMRQQIELEAIRAA